MSILTLIAVGIGGAAGAMCRYAITIGFTTHGDGLQPLATLVVNALGSGLLGIIYGLSLICITLTDMEHGLLAVGFLGALTTFSTFSLHVFAIAQRGGLILAGGYILASVALSLLLFGSGMYLAKSIANGH